ncbi:MAG: NADH-quinone oxidoreductase subunit M, partial [Chloroflexi bacterium]|nr:NADH-quinone oxidoreductase subunit M [Chloroflexota bacterium]
YLFTILALETSLVGVLVSIDMLLFYVFWEAMLIPMYFLISVWGGERRAYASLKFIVYMMLGSLLMLAGILWFYWWHHTHNGTGAYSFDLVQWISMNASAASRIPHSIQMWMFFFFFISFAIKLPLFPFHTWLPDAQEEGPVAFNVLLIEVGAYAFVRFCLPLFPDASLTWAPVLMSLAVINIVYGAILAAVQTDLKRLFAYSQMSHAGFMMLGIFAMTVQGISGSVLYMINSGITGAALYIIADLLYRRRRSRNINDFGGLAPKMPLLFFIFLFVALGAIGLPGLNGFVSEFLVLLGAIRSSVVSPSYGYAAGAGVVLSSVYMLWMFQRVMYGQRPAALDDAPDLEGSEKWCLWPFVVVILAIGLGSAWLTQPMRPASSSVIEAVQNGVAGGSQA